MTAAQGVRALGLWPRDMFARLELGTNIMQVEFDLDELARAGKVSVHDLGVPGGKRYYLPSKRGTE